MDKVKIGIISLVIGVLIGFLLCFLIFHKKNSVEVVKDVEYVYIEKNKEEITEKPKATVKMNRKDVDVINSLETPYYGNILLKTT
ncbi:MAG: hypothetical protein ACRC31_02360, partial [Cetobacterium sp.]